MKTGIKVCAIALLMLVKMAFVESAETSTMIKVMPRGFSIVNLYVFDPDSSSLSKAVQYISLSDGTSTTVSIANDTFGLNFLDPDGDNAYARFKSDSSGKISFVGWGELADPSVKGSQIIVKVDNETTPSLIAFTPDPLPKGKGTDSGESIFTQKNKTPSREIPPPPGGWFVSKTGITNEVLWPYLPIKVDKNTVHIWNKDITFATTGFPESVIVNGKELLSQPVKLEVRINQEIVPFKNSVTPLELTPARCIYNSNNQSTYLDLACQSTIEQDGMIRFDVRVKPKSETVVIDEFSLIIPVRPEYSKYLHHTTGGGAGTNSFALQGPWYGAYTGMPLIYLCNEESGIAWFWESDENTDLVNPEKAIQVIPKKDRTVLRINLFDHPVRLSQTFSFTFGLQASPLRPMSPAGWAKNRICQVTQKNPEKREAPSLLPPGPMVYPGKGNIDAERGTLEVWVKLDFDSKEISTELPKMLSYKKFLNLFVLELENRDHLRLELDDRSAKIRIQTNKEDSLILESSTGIPKNSWSHVSISWGDELCLYVNGSLVASRKWDGLFGKKMDSKITYLTFQGPYILDELRISRKSGFLSSPEKAPLADENTLLLDHIDDSFIPDWQETTIPEKGIGGSPYYGMSFIHAKFGQGVKLYKGWKDKTMLDVAQEAGIKTIIFHESWTDKPSYVETDDEEWFRFIIREAHKRGMKVIPYFGFEMLENIPEFTDYAEKCLLMQPEKVQVRKDPVPGYIVCLNSPWSDILVDGIERLFKKYDIDGVYLDSTIAPFLCGNLQHGCGYIDTDGKIKYTSPVFAVREVIKRIYAVCLKYRKEAVFVDAHQSGYLGLPMMAFTTSYYDNEPVAGLLYANPEKRLMDYISLETFRCEFMGHNVGVPAELITGTFQGIWDGITLSLLHDVMIRPWWEAEPAFPPIWNAVNEFVGDGTEWIPYWHSADYLRCEPDEILASLYVKPNKEVLIVVANIGREDKIANIILKPDALKLNLPISATGAITGKVIKIENTTISFPLRNMGVKLIHLQEKAK